MDKCNFCEYSYFNANGNKVCWLNGFRQEDRSSHCLVAIDKMCETLKKGKDKEDE